MLNKLAVVLSTYWVIVYKLDYFNLLKVPLG